MILINDQPVTALPGFDPEQLLIRGGFEFDNPLDPSSVDGTIYRSFRNVEDSIVLNYMDGPEFVLQRFDSCEKKSSKPSFNFDRERHTVCSVDMFETLCKDAFYQICGRKFDSGEFGRGKAMTPAQVQLIGAITKLLMRAIRSDVYKLVWFGDAEVSNSTFSCISDPELRAKVHRFFALCTGVWKEIGKRSLDVVDIAPMSSSAGAARQALQDLYDAQDSEMSLHPDTDKQYLVSNCLYRNYRDYLENLGCLSTCTWFMTGVPGAEKGLLFKGIPVIPMPEWDAIDSKWLCAPGECRAILTRTNNIAVMSNVAANEPRILIENGKDVQTRDIWYWQSEFKIKGGIGDPRYLVAGKAS